MLSRLFPSARAGAVPPELRTFFLVGVGQLVSSLGSGLTRFGLGVWVFEQTGSPTQFAMILLSGVLPLVLVSPVAGAYVDRLNRKKVMVLSDAGAALGMLLLAVLLLADRLETGYIYLVVLLGSTLGAFQGPAHAATTSLLVPREHLARAMGLVQFGQAGVRIVGPLLAAMLMGVIGIEGLLLLDFGTFLVATATLVVARIPDPPRAVGAPRRSVWHEAAEGWGYVTARRGLLGLLAIIAVVNLGMGLAQSLYQPMVLSFASREALGMISSIGGGGMLAGSLLLGAWGGPRRKIHGVLGGMLAVGVGTALFGVRASVPVMAAILFGVFFCIPIVNGCASAILMRRVIPHMQGRVFATQGMIVTSTLPIAYLAAGPLAEWAEPMLRAGGALAASVGSVIGVGPGRGMGLIFIAMGTGMAMAGAVGFLSPSVRGVEDLPDAPHPTDAPPGRSGPPAAEEPVASARE